MSYDFHNDVHAVDADGYEQLDCLIMTPETNRII